MAVIINKELAIKLLQNARDSKPEGYTYTQVNDACVYAVALENEPSVLEPSCIIGNVLAQVAVGDLEMGPMELQMFLFDLIARGGSVFALARYDNDFGHEFISDDSWLAQHDIALTREAYILFMAAQSRQDAGYTWTHAVAYAIEELESHPESWYRAWHNTGIQLAED